MIKMLIIVIHQFFKLLENYTQGRAITVTTNRQIKVKTKKTNPNNTLGFERGINSQKMTNTPIESYP
jgi:hypothetical protein